MPRLPHASELQRALPQAPRTHGLDCRIETRDRESSIDGSDGVTSARRQALLWLLQRASAGVLGICVIVHLTTMVFAVRGGLTADEILTRTRGSIVWASF
jgi:hypothetical protein